MWMRSLPHDGSLFADWKHLGVVGGGKKHRGEGGVLSAGCNLSSTRVMDRHAIAISSTSRTTREHFCVQFEHPE